MTGEGSRATPGADALARDDLDGRSIQPLDLSFELVVVVATRPEDEPLLDSGLLQRAHRAGAQTLLVVATDGVAPEDGSSAGDRAERVQVRRDAMRDAVAASAPDTEVRFLGLAAGELDRAKGELRERLGAIFDQLRAPDPRGVLVAAPWAEERGEDHRTVAEVTAALAAHRRFAAVEYPAQT